MKPAIVSHHDYKSSLRKRLDAIYPDKSRIPKNIGIIYRKFRDLDLSEVDRMMQQKKEKSLAALLCRAEIL